MLTRRRISDWGCSIVGDRNIGSFFSSQVLANTERLIDSLESTGGKNAEFCFYKVIRRGRFR